ncbi:MAG: twin-arginine translocase subunit TatC [Bacteroidales bacterium]
MGNTKNSNESINTESEMSFWEHLEELRWHLIRSVLVIIILAIIAFFGKKFIFDEILYAPLNNDFLTYKGLCAIGKALNINNLCLDNSKIQLININMSGQFMTHLYVSFMAGLTIGFPYLLSEIWKFIKPALNSKEKKNSNYAVFVCSFLFFLGVLFSYYVITPLTINFLGNYQTSTMVNNTIHLKSYISTVVSLNFSVGLVFELPIIIYFLTKVGLITSGFLRKNRKYTFVVLLVLSAIITPPDIFSQILVVIPLMLLYELGINISKRIEKKEAALS